MRFQTHRLIRRYTVEMLQLSEDHSCETPAIYLSMELAMGPLVHPVQNKHNETNTAIDRILAMIYIMA